MNRKLTSTFGSLAIAAIAVSANSAPVYQMPGATLTYGDVTHGQRALSAAGNPAAAAADLARAETRGERRGGMAVSFVAGIEYGNVDELFDKIDEWSRDYNPSPPGSGGGPGQGPKPPDGGGIGGIDPIDPDLARIIDAAVEELKDQVAILAFIEFELSAKAYASVDVPIVIGREFLGGSWTFGVNTSGVSKAVGLADPIEFDPEAALADLEAQFDPAAGGSRDIYDVAGDINFVFDYLNGTIDLLFDTDSMLLTKAATTTELAAGYSRRALSLGGGELYVGAEGKVYLQQLSRVGVRFGDITDSEALFDAIDNADYRRDEGIGIDLGVLWVGGAFQAGASLTNLNEPSFLFPAIDDSVIRAQSISNFLRADQKYTMERQLKLEGSWFGSDRRWLANVGVDANAVPDHIGDEFQWLTLSGGFQPDTRWLQSLRFGLRRNLAGSELSFASAGLTAFKFFNLDLASALDTVSYKGDKLPQGLILSMGFQVNF